MLVLLAEGVAEGFADGDGEHEGRFTYCLGTVNGRCFGPRR